MVGSLRSFRAGDRPAVLELSRRALQREQEQVGNPLWASLGELESELADWETPPEETLFVVEADGRVVGFGGVEATAGFEHADLFGPLIAPEYRGHRLGKELLDVSVETARARERHGLLASVGTRNKSGRLLLEGAGFHPYGGANAVFRLRPEDHRPREDGAPGVTVRVGEPADLEAAFRLYKECFPGGLFPEGAWRHGLERGTVYLAEEAGALLAVVNIDPSDRWLYHVCVVESERSRGVGGVLVSRALADYWRRHPGDVLGLSLGADNVPAIRLYRRQGFAPLLVLQSFQLPL